MKENRIEVWVEREAFGQLIRIRDSWGRFTEPHKQRLVKWIQSRAMYKARGQFGIVGLGERSNDRALIEVVELFQALNDADQREVVKQADLYNVRRAS